MKCEENGGCPFMGGMGFEGEGFCGMMLGDCHLTPDLFPLLRAMIAGEWKCETCLGNSPEPQFYCEHQFHQQPCRAWRKRGEE